MKLSMNEAALIFAIVGQQVPGYNNIRVYPKEADDAFRALYGKPYHHKMMRVDGDSLCCSGVRPNIVSELQSNYGRLSKGEAALIYAIVNEEEISVGRALSAMGALSSSPIAYGIDEGLMSTSYKDVVKKEEMEAKKCL